MTGEHATPRRRGGRLMGARAGRVNRGLLGRSPAGRVPAFAVAVAVLAALAGGCSHPAGPAGAPTMRLADCGGNPQDRPRIVVVTCAEGAITARNLTWSGWGGKIATATGSAVVNVCAYSDCHTGSYGSYPIVLVASGALACPKGTHGYARIQYVFVGRSPFQGLPAEMKVPSTWWGPAGIGVPMVARPCR